MYNTMWTGTYEFKSELKTLLKAFEEYVQSIIVKIEDAEKLIDE